MLVAKPQLYGLRSRHPPFKVSPRRYYSARLLDRPSSRFCVLSTTLTRLLEPWGESLMRKLLCVSLLVLFGTNQALADGYSATEAASYTVNRATAAPVIDGVVGDGEWGAASAAADMWVNLRADTPDSHNLRFQALWDDTHLYILGMSDYDNFVNAEDHGTAVPADPDFDDEIFIGVPNNPDWGGGGYNGNFYFDPNTDGERTWDGEHVPNSEVDGYQIAWDIFEGFAARRPTEGAPEQSFRDPLDADGNQINDYYGGLFLEAHANAAFGNQGLWELSNEGPNANYRDDAQAGLVYAQNASNDDLNGTGQPGAVWEWAISWDSFSATNPNKLVTQEEADARGPAVVVDDREFIEVPDPDFPDEMIEVENPDFEKEVVNVGQLPGIAAYIGEPGEPDQRFSDPESPVFIDNGLYAADGPAPGDVWGFETTVITNQQADNFLPSWSEPQGGDPTRGGSFAPWGTVGHGRLIFGGDVADGGCVIPEGGITGDLDGNGSVEFADFLALSANFGQTEGTTYEAGDIDCDGEVAFADFLALSGNFGATAAGAASVPEPNGIALLLLGLVPLLRRRR